MPKILIVDDDALIRRMVARVLVGAGHEVVEARDGQEGLKLFRIHHPALVITDIVMPAQEGIETILELRREAPTLAIIAMSGGGQGNGMSYLDFASKLGADATLPKPFRPAELIEAVNKLLPPSAPMTPTRKASAT